MGKNAKVVGALRSSWSEYFMVQYENRLDSTCDFNIGSNHRNENSVVLFCEIKI